MKTPLLFLIALLLTTSVLANHQGTVTDGMIITDPDVSCTGKADGTLCQAGACLMAYCRSGQCIAEYDGPVCGGNVCCGWAGTGPGYEWACINNECVNTLEQPTACSYAGTDPAAPLTCGGDCPSTRIQTMIDGQPYKVDGNYFARCCNFDQCSDADSCYNIGDINPHDQAYICGADNQFHKCDPNGRQLRFAGIIYTCTNSRWVVTPETCAPFSTAPCSAGTCAGTQTCNGLGTAYGACVKNDPACGTCTNQCTPPSSTCQGTSVLSCMQNPTTGCFEYQTTQTCTGSQTCSGGTCICVPSCTNKACGASDGCGGTCQTGTCAAGLTCNAGACTACPVTCTVGTRMCENGVKECQAQTNGCNAWVTVQQCTNSQICSNGACRDRCQNTCAPGSSICAIPAGSYIQVSAEETAVLFNGATYSAKIVGMTIASATVIGDVDLPPPTRTTVINITRIYDGQSIRKTITFRNTQTHIDVELGATLSYDGTMLTISPLYSATGRLSCQANATGCYHYVPIDGCGTTAACDDGVCINSCNAGDGTCPAGCTFATDTDCPIISASCTDSDHGKYPAVRGAVTRGVDDMAYPPVYDTCEGNAVREYFCNNNTMGQEVISCTNSCVNGACTAQSQCSDGIDNDRDGAVDFPADPGCAAQSDTNEGDASDFDQDGCVDTADAFPTLWSPDSDSDGVADDCDNCIMEPNSDQADQDNDGIGNSCDVICPSLPLCGPGYELIITDTEPCSTGYCRAIPMCGNGILESGEECEGYSTLTIGLPAVINIPVTAVPGGFGASTTILGNTYTISFSIPQGVLTFQNSTLITVPLTQTDGVYRGTLTLHGVDIPVSFRAAIFGETNTCSELGYSGGFLSCSHCVFNTTACIGQVCGNGIAENGEQCDAGSANGACPASCSASCIANSCSTDGGSSGSGDGSSGGSGGRGGSASGDCSWGFHKEGDKCVKDEVETIAPAPEPERKVETAELAFDYDSSIYVAPFEELEYEVTVTGTGDEGTRNVRVSLDVPAGWEYSGPVDLGDIADGQSKTATFTLISACSAEPASIGVDVHTANRGDEERSVEVSVDAPLFTVQSKPAEDDIPICALVHNAGSRRRERLEIELEVNSARRTLAIDYYGTFALDPGESRAVMFEVPAGASGATSVGYLRENGRRIETSINTIEVYK